MPRPLKYEPWMPEAVEHMARNGCSLKQAVTELGIPLTSEECSAISRRKFFQNLLWEARHRASASIGSDPNYTKETAIGRLIVLAQKLEEEGANDKAAEVVLKIAKIQGWVGPESTVSVFGELSQRDLDAIRESVSKPTTASPN